MEDQKMIRAIEAKRKSTGASLKEFDQWLRTASAKDVLSAIVYYEETHCCASRLVRDMLASLNS